MSAQVIYLWGGPYEHRMRVPTSRNATDATIIVLPVIDMGRPFRRPFRKRRVRVTQVSTKPAC